MTPMIDVVFLLLTFFIIASAEQNVEEIMSANLPPGTIASPVEKSDEPEQEQRPVVRIQLSPGDEGRTIAFYNETPFALEELDHQLVQLSELDPSIEVILDVEGGVSFGEVIQVYDSCRQARLETVKFAVGE